MTRTKRLKLAAIISGMTFLAIMWCWPVAADSPADHFVAPPDYEMPFGHDPFAPSNARTTTGQFISQTEFIPAARCASCHKKTHAEWVESAHGNSFREPFYQTNVKHLIRDRGIAVTRHCESCHNPVALFSGALTADSKMPRPFDEEGVSCSVCHSIQSVSTKGVGSYVMAPPALLAREDGTRVRDASDEDIWNDVASHRRAVSRPLLKTPEFCAACHKAAVVPELNKRKWLRSFSVYDEWQQSALSGEAVQPLNKRERQSCQSCHMPKPANGFASHRWPGANTAIPAFYNWPKQTEVITQFLKSNPLAVDVFALRAEAAGASPVAAPLDKAVMPETALRGREVTVDVVVANRNVGHSFPPEQRDIYEAWLEFEATDADGRTLIHSGAVRDDGSLEESAHAYKTIPIDAGGQPITKHDIWNTRVAGFDRHIPAGRADVGRFSFVVPADARFPLKLSARLNYRRFNRKYNEWVAREFPVKPSPVVEMTETVATLAAGGAPPASASAPRQKSGDAELRKRWRVYGVALFDQQQYEQAAYAFERALELAPQGSPDEAASLVDTAMTLLRMERTGSSAAVLARAEKSLARALEIAPRDARARFHRALLSVKQFKYSQALADFESLAGEYPRDRQVWLKIASLYLLQRMDKKALEAYERVVEIDPDDNEANFKLAGLYWRFGKVELAKQTQDEYQSRHTDTVGETLRRDYLRARPELYLTWPWREFGDNPIGSTP